MSANQNQWNPEPPNADGPERWESIDPQERQYEEDDVHTEKERAIEPPLKEHYKPVNAGGNPLQTPANDGKVSDPDIDPRKDGEYSSSAPKWDAFEEENDKGDSNNTDVGL